MVKVAIGFKKTKIGMRYYKASGFGGQTLMAISKKEVEKLRKENKVTEFFNIDRFKN